MRFDNSWILLLLLLIPALVFVIRHRRHSSILFSDLKVAKKLEPSFLTKYRNIPIVLRLLVILLIIISLACPQINLGTKTKTYGIDIMLILDISGSMRAEDFKPKNRLQAAKRVIREFLRGRQNDQVGLVVFAGKSYTQCPLTLDYKMLIKLLNNVKIGGIEDGTAIGMAIANAIERLRDSEVKSKVVILLTDGVNNKGKITPITAAQTASSLDIRIYTIGVGKRGGAPIPKYDPIFGKDYIRNPDGSLYLTKVNEETLRQIAEMTGAQYFRAVDEDKLSRIYEEIAKMEKTKIEIKKYTKYQELAVYFLLPALLLFILEIILSNTRFRKIP